MKSAGVSFGLCCVVASVVACSGDPRREGENVSIGSASSRIVDVPQTPVERQSIGNCWVYAHASWAESMHKKASGEDFDISQSYWTYLHWFRQITTGTGITDKNEVQTAGGWWELREIARRYGLTREQDFVPQDVDYEISYRQKQALDSVNQALKEGGQLATAQDRSNPIKVRDVLDTAWDLPETVKTRLDAVFGEGLERDFRTGAQPDAETLIVPIKAFAVAYAPAGQALIHTDLGTAFSEWTTIFYPSGDEARRSALIRLQRAAHANEPVILSWFVDFNALEYDKTNPFYGSFNLATLKTKAQPGRQGGHMVVLEDYEAVVTPSTTTTTVNDLGTVNSALQQGATFHVGSYTLEEGSTLRVTMTVDGDGDLYVRKGEEPSTTAYDCRPYQNGSQETCELRGVGTYNINVFGYAGPSNLTIKIESVRVVTTAEPPRTLKAGTALEPSNPADKALLDAALAPSAQITFLRVKNSWGGRERPELPYAPGPSQEFGYHDLYMDYLNGPISQKKDEACETTCETSDTTPLSYMIVPPRY